MSETKKSFEDQLKDLDKLLKEGTKKPPKDKTWDRMKKEILYNLPRTPKYKKKRKVNTYG